MTDEIEELFELFKSLKKRVEDLEKWQNDVLLEDMEKEE